MIGKKPCFSCKADLAAVSIKIRSCVPCCRVLAPVGRPAATPLSELCGALLEPSELCLLAKHCWLWCVSVAKILPLWRGLNYK